jgi:hypothetical protein
MDDGERASNASIAEVERLVRQVESLPDPHARATAAKLVAAVMEFHASALNRILEIAGDETVQKIAGDQLAGSLLVVHGLHPDDVETRIRRAVDQLDRYFDSRGAKVSLTNFEGGAVRLRFQAMRAGSASAAVKEIVENAIYQAAPEIAELVIEGLDEGRESREPGFVPLSALLAAPGR